MTIPNEVAAVLAEMREAGAHDNDAWGAWLIDLADRIESALTKAEAVAPDFSVSIGGLNVPLSTAVERMRKRAQELQARQRILSACVSKADPADGGTANLLYCAADTIEKLQLATPATPAESSEQVIDLLLAGGFIDKDKLRVAREIIAGCKKPAVPVGSLGGGADELFGGKPIGSAECPITGRKFFTNVEHPELGMVATYGGPFDSYTIPELGDDDELRCERYDWDAGNWVEGGEPVGYFYEDQQEGPAEPVASVPDGWLLGWARPVEIKKTQSHRSKREGSAIAVFVHAEKNETYSVPVYARPTNQEGAAP